MKVGDLVTNKGFIDDGPHYGAWGVVTDIKSDVAEVRFTRLHSPRPDKAGAEIMSAARFMGGKSVQIYLEDVLKVGQVPADDGMSNVWDWYAPITRMQTNTIRALWFEALRSGEYRQTRHCLRDRRGFSAMGVACDLIGKRYGITWRHMERVAGILGNYTTMPKAFLKLLGIDAKEAEFIEKLSDNGRSFDEIANYVTGRHASDMRLAS